MVGCLALVAAIRKSGSIDWTRKESVRARMRIEVRKLVGAIWISTRSLESCGRSGRPIAEAFANVWN
ncbi:type I restriction enzyme endonuclease domain-containing protein [Bradyrhizobium sp. SZCCHNR1015]|uniref:type I restriction enzyme endonuclease domain-containing protein n=1 Tax=Bradyrhizobium sp. SZCCHNR1015 TaxID=3057338 RepID=UPI00396707FD